MRIQQLTSINRKQLWSSKGEPHLLHLLLSQSQPLTPSYYHHSLRPDSHDTHFLSSSPFSSSSFSSPFLYSLLQLSHYYSLFAISFSTIKLQQSESNDITQRRLLFLASQLYRLHYLYIMTIIITTISTNKRKDDSNNKIILTK